MFDGQRADRRLRGKRVKSLLAVLFSFSLLIGAGWFVADKVAGVYADVTKVEDFTGDGVDKVLVTVPKGASVTEIGGLLIEKNVVKSKKAWDRAVASGADTTKIQAGRYRLKTELPARTALDMLLDKKNLAIKRFTVPEGLRLGEQLDLLSKRAGVSRKSLDEAVKHGDKIGLPKYAHGNAEGLLFPDTYDVDDDANAEKILATMVEQYRKTTSSLDWKAKAKKNGHTPYEMLIVASIIEAETRRDVDRPKVARVLYNRLDHDMRLQLDTTVMYANHKRQGATTSDAERANQSPYNTYTHDGLPPGPISAPGKKSLEAAANPAKGDWLYFVAVNLDTGETKFAKSSGGHAKNVKEFQAWCRKNKGKC